MNDPVTPLKALLAVSILTAPILDGEVLAFTDFDDSAIGAASNIKTDLNWTLNGLEDPGDMAALNAGGGNQTVFDGNSFVQDIFIPGLNTGNGNTFWTTEVSLTVAPGGAEVTLTDVTFNSVSVSGSQAENVNRRNDYALTLLDPSGSTIEEVTVADTTAGNVAGQPLVTFDFTDVLLSEPGSYTLLIKGGDFAGTDETGNHTGLDNLSINGTTGGDSPDLTITDIVLSGGDVVLTTNLPAADLVPQISQDLNGFTDIDSEDFSVTGTNEITIDSSVLSAPSDFFRIRN